MDEEEKEDEEDERLKHDENEDQNGEGSAMGESDEETPPLIEALELLFRLTMDLNTEEVLDGRPASTLLCILAVSLNSQPISPASSRLGRTRPALQHRYTNNASYCKFPTNSPRLAWAQCMLRLA
jgi:hypothetical protein